MSEQPGEPPAAMSRSVMGGLGALLTGRAFSFSLQLVAFGVLAAHLGPRGLGVYTFAVGFAAIFELVTNFGFRPVLTRDVSQQPDRERTLLPNVVYLRLALGVLSYGLLVVVVYAAGYDAGERDAALVAGVLLLLFSVETFQTALEVRLKLRWAAVAESVKAVARLVGVIVLASRGSDVVPFLWLNVATAGVGFAIVAVAALRLGAFSWRPRPELWTPVLRAAAPIGVASLFIALYYRLDIALLARFKSDADVGQYGAAYRFLETFVVLPTVVMAVLSPVISRSVVEGHEVLSRRWSRILHLVSLLAVPVAVAGAMCAWRLLPVVPGFGEYEGAGVALAILAPGAAVIFVAMVVQGVLVSSHLQGLLLRISAGGLVLNLAANAALIPPFSYVGAAIATTATEVFVLGWSLVQARRRLGLGWPTDRLGRTGVATGVLAAVLVPGYLLHPLAQLAIGLIAYATALIALKAVSWEDVRGLVPEHGPLLRAATVFGYRRPVAEGT